MTEYKISLSQVEALRTIVTQLNDIASPPDRAIAAGLRVDALNILVELPLADGTIRGDDYSLVIVRVIEDGSLVAAFTDFATAAEFVTNHEWADREKVTIGINYKAV